MLFQSKGPNDTIPMPDGSIGMILRRRDDFSVAGVSAANYEKVKQYRWFRAGFAKKHPRSTHYAMAMIRQPGGKRRAIHLHTFLFGREGVIVDHKDGNGLDCRDSNIRITVRFGNAQHQGKQRSNSSGYKGISPHGSGWRAEIRANGVRSYLGTYRTKENAAHAYDAACLQHHGEFAVLNFPEVR